MERLQKTAVLVFILFGAASCDPTDISVEFYCGDHHKYCDLLIGETFNLTVIQVAPKAQSLTYHFRYSVGGETCSEPKKNGKFMFLPIEDPLELTGNVTKIISVDTSLGNNSAGELRIALNNSHMPKEKVVGITITRSNWLKDFGMVVGWIYFIAWSISFYPQCWINFKRKSVIGLNFDFVALNLTGFTCYAIYTLSLFYNHEVRHYYFKAHPLGVIQVEWNDIFFVIHAIFLTLITIVQCFLYERGEQSISKFCRMLLFLMFLFALVSLIVAGAGVINWLTYVEYLSYVKLFITVIKYMPQAYMNYKRKSTDGWSIGNILLDFTGGSLSIMQMFLKAYNYDDWKSIFGNVTKFGLGFFSVLFDILFILQHYVFYRQNIPYDEIINGNRVRSV